MTLAQRYLHPVALTSYIFQLVVVTSYLHIVVVTSYIFHVLVTNYSHTMVTSYGKSTKLYFSFRLGVPLHAETTIRISQ